MPPSPTAVPSLFTAFNPEARRAGSAIATVVKFYQKMLCKLSLAKSEADPAEDPSARGAWRQSVARSRKCAASARRVASRNDDHSFAILDAVIHRSLTYLWGFAFGVAIPIGSGAGLGLLVRSVVAVGIFCNAAISIQIPPCAPWSYGSMFVFCALLLFFAEPEVCAHTVTRVSTAAAFRPGHTTGHLQCSLDFAQLCQSDRPRPSTLMTPGLPEFICM